METNQEYPNAVAVLVNHDHDVFVIESFGEIFESELLNFGSYFVDWCIPSPNHNKPGIWIWCGFIWHVDDDGGYDHKGIWRKVSSGEAWKIAQGVSLWPNGLEQSFYDLFKRRKPTGPGLKIIETEQTPEDPV